MLKFKSSVVDPVKEMWEGQGPYLTVQGVTFGFAELSRMLHVHGPKAYINDNIIDVIGGLMNEEDGDFWVFQAHLYEKFTRNDGVERWIQRSMKKWERKWGKKYFPKMVFIPFAVGLHCRLFIWNTHRDRIVYVDRFDQLNVSPEQEWVESGIKICAKIRHVFSGFELSPPGYGMELPLFPTQEDGCSCGLYVVLYMVMSMQGYHTVRFPPSATNALRILLAKCLGRQFFPLASTVNHLFLASTKLSRFIF